MRKPQRRTLRLLGMGAFTAALAFALGTTVGVLDTSAGMVGITVDGDTAVPVAVTSLEVWRAVAAAIAPWS